MIRLSVADPSFVTPSVIRNAATTALDHEYTHYCGARGLEILRKAISEFYSEKYSLEVNPATQILPTNGAGEALYLILHAIAEDGKELIIPNPTYHGFIHKLEHFKLKPVFVPLDTRNGFVLDVDAISSAVNERTRAIFLCNPNNPTGVVYSKAQLEKVGDILRKNKHVRLILDECYSRILYDSTRYYGLYEDNSIRNQIFIVNSFSKTYAMTGWRLGYMIATESLIDQITKIAFDVRSSVNAFVQSAGVRALKMDPKEIELMVNEYHSRRDLVMSYLRGMALSFPVPQGGFEVFVDFSAYGMKSADLKKQLEHEAHVQTVAGSEFGPQGEGYLRLVFCVDRDKLIEGMGRIKSHLGALRQI